mgnify:CR=1
MILSLCRNPAVENQGLDRIHRLGQMRPVITTKLIMSHSIEGELSVWRSNPRQR